jgi:hypothetical protein
MEEIECKICNRKFQTKESLEHHNRDKHGSESEKKSESRKSIKKYVLTGIILLSIILLAAAFYIKSQKPSRFDDFARCLSEKKVIIYGNDACQYTIKQRNLFENAQKYLTYVKCADNKELCDSKGVKITPTWEINGKMYEGVQTFEMLSDLSGCSLK